MGIFVFLPLVLPLTAWPVARLAAQRLHPRTATRLLTAVAGVMAACSTLCLALLMVVGTAQLPGNPLPDGWSDPEVRAAVPQDEIAGKAAIPALVAVVAGVRTLWRHAGLRRRAHEALAGLPPTEVAVLPDAEAYAYALPGRRGGRGRIVVSSALLAELRPAERRAVFAHERAHLAARHHRHLLTVRLAARLNPFLRPLSSAVAYTAERWADEEAAARVGDRRAVARAIGKVALSGGAVREPVFAGLAAPGPVPRRVAALLAPAPPASARPTAFTTVGLAVWTAGAGAAASAMSSANSAVTLAFTLHAATPW
ncbi:MULTISPECIES: M56 family metallopeptidase [unclassified Streptomyces]|uniref:M56 family metallopeptidase n=1 Tax=unclassified Streptomyces TaxID=2593676 RepID=UPI000DB9F8EC|nr:M56 family metallopeptidase [Streptomyces sp. PsTaAH-137]MYT70041.1 M48 family metalloprotease [Streptomyces sp. SID8367]RAJ88614.1 peptidase M48-like protein [Streptomyces sp. PsTaAH-137]